MKKLKQILLMTGLCLGIVYFAFPSISIAANEQGEFNYQVKFPDNQIDKSKGYFYLKMSPGQKQTVMIHFNNPSKVKVVVDVALNSAKTNANGVIEYGPSKIKTDKSVKFPFNKIVTGPNKVELQPGEEKDVPFDISMPDTQYDGQIVGGIQLKQANQGAGQDKQGGSVVINEYAYIIAVVLQETDVEVVPKLSFNKAYADQSNFRNQVIVDYSNTEASYVNNMTTEVQITKKGDSNVLYERKQAKMRMAPNTSIKFPVSMNGEAMVPGNYTATILVKADNNINEKWVKDFEITKEQADKFNERDAGLVQDKGFDWKLVVMIVVGAIIAIGVIFIIITIIRKNKEKSTSKSKKKKRK